MRASPSVLDLQTDSADGRATPKCADKNRKELMAHIITPFTMPGPEDCRTTCPRCGMGVTARFTPQVTTTPSGLSITSAWTVTHPEPRCEDEVLGRILWSSEDIDWVLCDQGPTLQWKGKAR